MMLGTADLSWAIPVLLAALMGKNGQSAAAGLLAGALKGKIKQRDTANRLLIEQQRRKPKLPQFPQLPMPPIANDPAQAAFNRPIPAPPDVLKRLQAKAKQRQSM
jgi:hypothetical protein